MFEIEKTKKSLFELTLFHPYLYLNLYLQLEKVKILQHLLEKGSDLGLEKESIHLEMEWKELKKELKK